MPRITFRPTDIALSKLNAIMQEKGVNQSAAINLALESWGVQLEQPKKERKITSLDLPLFLFCEKEHRWFLTETLLTECPKCRDHKICSAWKHRPL